MGLQNTPLGRLFGLVTFLLNTFIDIQQEKQKTKLAIQKKKTQLASQKNAYITQWEMAKLEEKDNTIRRICFGILLLPFFWGIIDPNGVKNYFALVVDPLPHWYTQMVVLMIGSVWGLKHLVNTFSSIGNGMGTIVKKLGKSRSKKDT